MSLATSDLPFSGRKFDVLRKDGEERENPRLDGGEAGIRTPVTLLG
jgi:hypothetical protein